MPDIYNFKVGEYDLTVTVTHENIRLSFNKESNKGVSEHQLLIIPLVSDPHNFSEFPFLGGDN